MRIRTAKIITYALPPVILSIGYFGKRLREGGPFYSGDLIAVVIGIAFTLVVGSLSWHIAKRMISKIRPE